MKEYTDLEFDYNASDYPDYCDTYIIRGLKNNIEMTEEELEELNNDSGLVYDLLMDYLF